MKAVIEIEPPVQKVVTIRLTESDALILHALIGKYPPTKASEYTKNAVTQDSFNGWAERVWTPLDSALEAAEIKTLI